MALFFTDKVYRQKMSLFLRYQSAVERAYDKAIKDLQVERKRRAQLGEPAPAPAPSPQPARSNGFVSRNLSHPVENVSQTPPAVLTVAAAPLAAAVPSVQRK
jgi:hypothetical protein